MKRSDIFEVEIGAIRDNGLRTLTKDYFNTVVPDYFFEVGASSSGKYHPWYSLGYGGLVRHTKAAVWIADDLLTLEQYKDLPHDEIIVALLIHDTFKRGVDSEHTLFEHPLLAYEAFYNYAIKGGFNECVVSSICSMVQSHMGQWNTSNTSRIELPKPRTTAQQFVHMCDYLASRKYITVEVK